MTTARMDRSSPSPWVTRFVPELDRSLPVIDVACGSGRHVASLLEHGYAVVALDRDTSGLSDLVHDPRLVVVTADLEKASPPPLAAGSFGGVVVTNYLHRPLFPWLMTLLAPGGWLIYETFMAETAVGPRNPDFLLQPGELIDLCQPALQVHAYGEVRSGDPLQVVAHVAATKPLVSH